MAFSRSYFCYTGRKADLLRRMAKIKKKQRCEHRRKKQTNNSRHQKETGGSDSGAHRCLEDPKRQRSTGATVDPVSASEATGSGPPPSTASGRLSHEARSFQRVSANETQPDPPPRSIDVLHRHGDDVIGSDELSEFEPSTVGVGDVEQARLPMAIVSGWVNNIVVAIGGGPKGPGSPNFWHILSFCASRDGVPNQSTVARLNSKYLALPKSLGGD